MSSDDSVASVTEGATRGFLEWTERKVKEYAIKFKNRNVAFVQDLETIETALEQRKTSEWDLFQKYVKDERLHILFQMGLTLRRMENNKEKLENLRAKIVKKYGAEGLHIAQFIQNGFFGKYIGNILERARTPEELTKEVENLFNNIELTTSFIQSFDNVDKEVEKIVIRINSHMPKTYIISGSKSAKKKCRLIFEEVKKRISGYTVEFIKTDVKEIYFLNKAT